MPNLLAQRTLLANEFGTIRTVRAEELLALLIPSQQSVTRHRLNISGDLQNLKDVFWSTKYALIGGIIAILIVHNILGHAIFAIARPDKYLPTLRSVVFSSLYGGLIGSSSLPLITIAVRIVLGTAFKRKLFAMLCCVPMGVIVNVVGVKVLEGRGYQSLPTLREAACVAAAGQAFALVMGTVHFCLWAPFSHNL
ncbi:hypothetical protein C8R47DRAFT_1320175 [Mycena vitilis]|nr:hypothetical protein C8R47DRAFT_1320175 [Mycena vitilis]